HRCTQSYNQIRKLSDEICAEHGKSVIKETTRTGKTYAEWMHERKGDSWKAKIKKDIDDCILISRSYEEFLQRMKDKGYEINGETFGEGSAKYISFRPYGKDRFVRGRAQSLGADYTKEKIRERIEERSSLGTEKVLQNISGPLLTIEEYLRKHQTGSPTSLIDTSGEKFANSIGLSKWADKENFKRFAAMYAELGGQGFQSIQELKDRIKELRLQAHQEKKTVISLEREIKEFGNIRSFAKQYLENKKYHINYQNSKDKERYYRMHFDQINMFDSASEWLKSSGINTATLNLSKIEEHYQKLIADKNRLSDSYIAKEAECDRLKKIDDSLSKFLDNPSQDRTAPDKKRDRNISL
ncbi:MAG: relaxase/mobilization nuclease domain-containing protein, partial [Lachnospiraceae bacterium]|nr:relaxase/mobilization nuclease domain-containing protein [Lachnospiraceae bacterium]